jgi:hypothetical protein
MKLFAKLLVDQINKAMIVKPRGKKYKRVKNTNEHWCNRIAVLTQKQTIWNNWIAHIRAYVESPFGLVKLK